MNCPFCGDDFRRGDGGYKYCSSQCTEKSNQKRKVGNGILRARVASVEVIENTKYKDIYIRDNETCNHCGCESDLTVDHIIPISRGGHHADYNLQVLCRKCNSKKGHKVLPSDFEKLKELSDIVQVIKNPPAKKSKGNTGYRGVHYRKDNNRYRSKIDHNNKTIVIGYYDSAEEAAIAYNEKAKELKGGNAILNKIDGGT